MINNEQEIEIQNKVAKSYEHKRYSKKYSLIYQNWLSKKIIKLIKPSGRVLDNGCGTGHFAESFLGNCEIFGLDISQEMVEYAKKRIKNVILGNAEDLPFKDNFFDFVIARSLLHHLSNPQRGIQEIRRVLKDNGKVVFVDTMESILSNLPRKILYRKSKHFSETHKNFKEPELVNIINSELKIIDIQYFGYVAYPLLGFSDILDIYKYFPFKFIFTPILIKIDELISKLPIFKKQAFGIIVLAQKNDKTKKNNIC